MSSLQHNSNPRATIEQIVRQVLAELRSRPAAKPSMNGSTAQLNLTTKVVSASLLEGRLEGISQLVVPRGAVITPAARDELRQRKVTIASAVGPAKSSADALVQAAVAGTRYDAQPLLAALSGDGLTVERSAATSLVASIEQLAAAAAAGFALLITDDVAAALCLANRQPGVRAALASNVAAVDAAVASIGPNLLVIAPTGRSVFEMKQTVRAWVRQGRPTCPAALSNHLG